MRHIETTKPIPFATMHETVYGTVDPATKAEMARAQLEIAIEALRRAESNIAAVAGSNHNVSKSVYRVLKDARVAKARLDLLLPNIPR
jgi:hypothetical protein